MHRRLAPMTVTLTYPCITNLAPKTLGAGLQRGSITGADTQVYQENQKRQSYNPSSELPFLPLNNSCPPCQQDLQEILALHQLASS